MADVTLNEGDLHQLSARIAAQVTQELKTALGGDFTRVQNKPQDRVPEGKTVTDGRNGSQMTS